VNIHCRTRTSQFVVVLVFCSAIPAHPARATSPPIPGCPGIHSTFTKDIPLAISSTGTPVIQSSILVSGLDPIIWDIDLQTFLTHTANGELSMRLTSPAGTVVTLTSGNGGQLANVFNGTVWDDDADPGGQVPYVTNNGLATDHAYVAFTVATPLVPEEAMGAFNGEDPNGVWNLTISDSVNGNGGSLDSWSLTIAAISLPARGLVGVGAGNPTDVVIPEIGVATTTREIMNFDGQICSFNVFTEIIHARPSDLDITVTSPAGTVVTLTTDNGGANSNVFDGTLWNDDAGTMNPPGAVTDNVFANMVVETPLVPEEAMAAFIGENPNGTWTLTVSDDQAGIGGLIDNWSIGFLTCDFPDSDGDGLADPCDPLPGLGGPDNFGYRYTDSNTPGGPPYQFIDISATGTEILPFNNGTVAGPLPIGFGFEFYGAPFTNAYLDDNGWLHLGDVAPASDQSNDCPLPSTTGVSNMIAGLWDALSPTDAMPKGRAFFQSFGAGNCPYNDYPGACFVAEWLDTYRDLSGGDDVTFEIVLLDNGDILVQILDAGAMHGFSATSGIENALENDGLTYDPDRGGGLRCNDAGHLTDNLAILYYIDSLDSDGIAGSIDNCPLVFNADQADADGDAIGDPCDICDGDDASGDADGDGVCGDVDNCPAVANADQADADSDGVGDACDGCPNDGDKTAPGACGCGVADTDADGNGTADCLDLPPAPPPQQNTGCCAPGVFPMVGLFTPLVLLGWKRRRRVGRQPLSVRRRSP
jgi:subtilisin-like proprotein convertase family protein